MEKDIESFLVKLGYEIGTENSKYFSVLMEDVVCQISEGKDNKKIREELPEIVRMYCYIFFRISKYDYYMKMKKFLKSKKNKKKKTHFDDHFTVEDYLIMLGKAYLKEKEKDSIKTIGYQKCKKK